MKKLFIIPLVLFLLQVAVLAQAASVRVDYVGNGVYYLRGLDFDNIGGVEVELQYDSAILANPRIAQGSSLSSSMFIPNPKLSASTVKIAAMSISPIKGGDLATITFDVIGDSASSANVNVRSSKLAAATGTPVKTDPPAPTLPSGTPPPVTGTQTTNPSVTETAQVPAGAGGGSSVGITGGGVSPSVGGLTLPPDQMAAAERKPDAQPLVSDLRKDLTIPYAGSETAPATAAATTAEGKNPEKKFVTYAGTLQLFKGFKDERNMQSLIALFADAELPGLTQNPPIAIADGKTPFRITLVLKPVGEDVPNFIMEGASVKQLAVNDVTWTIEAVPKKDVAEVRMTVLDGATIYEYPLTVAPKIEPLLSKGEKLSEADFALYLAKPSKFDLNKDGKFDAVDDFIYTANYIIAMKIKPEKSKKVETKEKSPAEKKDMPASKDLKPKNDKSKESEKTKPKTQDK